MRQLLVLGAVALVAVAPSKVFALAGPEVDQVMRVAVEIANAQTIRTEQQAIAALGNNPAGGQLWAAVKSMQRTLGRPLTGADFNAIRAVIRDKNLTEGLQVVELFTKGAAALKPGAAIAATFGQVTVTATRSYAVSAASAMEALTNYTCDSPKTCEAKQAVIDGSITTTGRSVAETTGAMIAESTATAPQVCPPSEVANCVRDGGAYAVLAAKEGAFLNVGGVGFGHDINNAFNQAGVDSYVGRGHLVRAGGRHSIEDRHIDQSAQLKSCVMTGKAN